MKKIKKFKDTDGGRDKSQKKRDNNLKKKKKMDFYVRESKQKIKRQFDDEQA